MDRDIIKLIILEDESSHAEAIRRALVAAGMDVEIQVSSTLREYRERVAARPPDIALADLNLPDGRAVDILISPPEDGPFPVLVMTSYGNEQIAVEAMKAGALDYVVKSPESFAAVPQILQRALREWKLLQERKHSEEEVARTAREWQGTFDSTNDSIWILDKGHRVLRSNKAAERIFHRPHGELIGKHCWEIVHGTTGPIPECPILRARESLRRETMELQIGEGWFEVAVDPILDSFGGYAGSVHIVSDITERKRAEKALRESEEKYRFLFESIPLSIGITTLDGRALVANRGCEELTGFTKEEFCALGEVNEMYVDHAQRKQLLALLQKEGKVRDFEAVLKRKDGTVYCALMNLDFIELAGERAVITIVRDITERKRSEEKALEMERRLLHAQKLESLGVLAGGIAHDFNNLLTAILGNLDLAHYDLSPVSPARTSVEEAIHATRRAEALTRQMLAYSGKGRFIVNDMDLSELVEENVHLLKAALFKSTTLSLHLGRELPAIQADAGQIQQVVMNLITNASESLGEQVGIVALSTGVMECDDAYLIRSRTEGKPPAGRFVWLEVTDTGCGMDEETKGRIFDPFFTTKFTGRGLGMSAVLGIVRGHQGAIMVESEVGKGTTIRVLFPASKTVPAGRGPKEKAAKGRIRDAGNPPLSGTVLVVDDEEMVRAPCAAMVEHAGYRALTAASGDEAVALLRNYADEIVCVILDLTMPGKDGVATFEALRKIKPDVRVILTSGYNEQDATQRFSGRGLAGFIKKPYEMEKLLAELGRVAASRYLHHER